MKRRIGIQGFLIFSSLAVILLFPKYFFSLHRSSRAVIILDTLGLCMVLCGFLARIVARGYKAEGSSDGRTLIRQGPYMLMRNPMYFGTFLIGAGIIIAALQWWVFIAFCIIYFGIYGPQVRKEERTLEERFGKEYREYCKITPRFFPHPGRLLSTNPSKYLRVRWVWIKREIPSVIPVVLFLIGIFLYTYGRATR
jgi:protein-S-isoprenylcysteine O-methyltransferase Ste14